LYHLCDAAFGQLLIASGPPLLALTWYHIGGVLVSTDSNFSKVFYALSPFSEPNPKKIILALAQPAAPTPARTMTKKCKAFGPFVNILHTSVVCAIGTSTAQLIFPLKTQFFAICLNF